MRSYLAPAAVVFLVFSAWTVFALSDGEPGEEAGEVAHLEKARAAVIQQLEALQDNDSPSPDAGIRTAWNYAHPSNQSATGPLDRFTQMLKSRAYRGLIDHGVHRVALLGASRDTATFEVLVFPGGNQAPLRYIWGVGKIRSGERAGEWGTIAVSPPSQAGSPPA
jgi:hypothetical protein